MTSTEFNVGFTGGKPSSRVLQVPGGKTSNIFGENGNGNGAESMSSASSDAGSGTPSCPSTPIPLNGNGIQLQQNGLINGSQGDSLSECSTPTHSQPSSASSSRRGSRQEDTKNRLFGTNELDTPRKRVVDRMKSNIFADEANAVRPSSARKYEHVIHRNPITGEVYDPVDKLNGHGINGKSNGVFNGNGSVSLPATPTRVRQPPGGKSSGIF